MKNSNTVTGIPNRESYIHNKVLFVDGLVGGGKGLISAIVGSLPRVEMWVSRSKIEQICGMHHLDHISMEGTVALLRSWIDKEFYNISIVRETNFRPKDMSSIFKDARPWRYFSRLFKNDGEEAIKRIRNEGMIINVMTHANTGYAEPIFNALGDRLVYVRIVRSPMTEYIHRLLVRWAQRWGDDFDGMILHYSSNSTPNNNVPFFMLGKEAEYLESSCMDRAILMLEAWQEYGDEVIDKLKESSKAKIIEIPFEKFVRDPDPYVKEIADALDTNIDWITKRMLKKQGVPRVSTSDAPVNKAYIKLGWSAPTKHSTIFQDFEASREEAKKTASLQAMNILDNISDKYIKRYKIE